MQLPRSAAAGWTTYVTNAHLFPRTAVAGLSSWFGIAITYIRFYRGLKAQGIDRKSLPYRSPLQPFAGWYAAIGCSVVVLVSTRLCRHRL